MTTHVTCAKGGSLPGCDSRRFSRRGFTLVELLVVIGIIAVLVSILLPTLAKARSQGQLVKCESNVRQLVVATMMFALDHKGYIPTMSDNTWAKQADPYQSHFSYRNNLGPNGQPLSSGGPVVVFDWASALIPYLGGQIGQSFETAATAQSKVFQCPADDWLSVPGLPPAPPAVAPGTLPTPGYTMLNNVTSGYYPVSYGINADVASCNVNNRAWDGAGDWIGVVGGPNINNTYGAGATVGEGANCQLNTVFRPQNVMLFADCGTRPVNWNGQAHNALNRNDLLAYTSNYNTAVISGVGNEGTLLGELSCLWLQLRIPTARHNIKQSTVNVGFCDGHAESVTLTNYRNVRISPFNWQK